MRIRRRIRVQGLVQGVGFRPFVHRLATGLGLAGFVGNDLGGVFIEVEGSLRALDTFVRALSADPPPLARVDEVSQVEIAPNGAAGFAVVASRRGPPAATWAAPDSAVCHDCLDELFDPTDHRYRYPFITCTNCGPRFTITAALPYDRPTTTMAGFAMCSRCRAQYHDPADRRFHAQPLACPDCGPQLWLEEAGAVTARGTDDVVAAVQRLLAGGAIVAIKGIGGYHLACDATNDAAVARLRRRKRRPGKPLAVMVADVATASSLARVGPAERALLQSAARPIVLLPAIGRDCLGAHHGRRSAGRRRRAPALAGAVAPDNPQLGLLLPYAPLHHLLFAPVPGHDAPVPRALVMTSGNLSEEPLCFDDDDARVRLAQVADAFLVHDRPIHVPCDDSVAKVVADRPMMVRRSRGYAPLPVRLPFEVPPILAVGGEIKNTFCLARGRDAWLSQHIGDMGNLVALQAFERAVEHFRAFYGVDPEHCAADLHPGYHTTAWAERRFGARVALVQHHHAHLAALLAEHRLPLGTEALGFVFDGTGYAPDGTTWGGEVLRGGYFAVERVGHLLPVPLPGGDVTVREPYRAALAYLAAAGIEWSKRLAPVRAASDAELRVVAGQLGNSAYRVTSSSMGRLFDAVASLLDVRHRVSYEAQAAIELEHLAASAWAWGSDEGGAGSRAGGSDEGGAGSRSGGSDEGGAGSRAGAGGLPSRPRYRFGLAGGVLDPRPVLRAIVADLAQGVPAAQCAASFHAALCDAVAEVAVMLAGDGAGAGAGDPGRAGTAPREPGGRGTVGLTGGVFQNELLATGCRDRLAREGFTVLTHSLVPPNDGGLALGQAVVAGVRAGSSGEQGAGLLYELHETELHETELHETEGG
jgi:hydrogenase maturation protein HypF